MTGSRTIAAALTAAALAATPLATLPALAQEAEAPADFTSSELDAFVVAYRDVVAIEQDYGTRVQQAADDAERQALVEEAQAEMTQVVQDAPDIEVERYIEILQTAQTDTELMEDLTARLEN